MNFGEMSFQDYFLSGTSNNSLAIQLNFGIKVMFFQIKSNRFFKI